MKHVIFFTKNQKNYLIEKSQSIHSGVSRRLRRLAGIETAFFWTSKTSDDPTRPKIHPPHSWALNAIFVYFWSMNTDDSGSQTFSSLKNIVGFVKRINDTHQFFHFWVSNIEGQLLRGQLSDAGTICYNEMKCCIVLAIAVTANLLYVKGYCRYFGSQTCWCRCHYCHKIKKYFELSK